MITMPFTAKAESGDTPLAPSPCWIGRSRSILAVGLLLTVAATWRMKSGLDRIAELEFTSRCIVIQEKIADRFESEVILLQSGAALFDASEKVTRRQWHVFARYRKPEQQLSGIQGFGFAPLITRAGLARHLRGVRSEGFPEYAVKPAGDRKFYAPVTYLEPFSGRNLRAFGYDMLAEPVRRAALEQARDTGGGALSAKVLLIQENGVDVQAGTLIYFPVYSRALPVETVAQRRVALLGWVYSPHRMNDLMEGILGRRAGEGKERIQLQLFDGLRQSPQTLLYETLTAAERKQPKKYLFTRQIQVAGRPWTLRFTQNREGLFTAGYLGVWLTMLGGGAVTILLFALIRSLLSTRRQAMRMSEKLTADLKESEYFAMDIMDSLTSGIVVLDPKGVIIAVNETWRNLSAENSADSCVVTSDMGKQYLDARRSDGEEDCEECAAVQQGIRAVLLGEKDAFSMEYGCVSPGERRWFIMRVSRLKGLRKGVVIIHTDITERKELAAQVQNARKYAENIVETVREPLVVLDLELMILSANQSFYDTFKATSQETVGKFIYDLGNRQWDIPRLRSLLENIFTNDTVINNYEVEHEFRAIGSRTILLNARQIIQGNIGPNIILLSLEDITKQKKIEEMLRYVGSHDRLTGLYNRAFFDEEMERLATGGLFPVSIVMADVNGLKKINDSQGHGAGDQLIQLASRIIKRVFRSEDIVARIGGDEFAILLPGAEKSVAEEVVARIMNSPEITAGQVSIAFGIGFAENGGMLGEALNLSDRRMYRDKAEQKIACYCHDSAG